MELADTASCDLVIPSNGGAPSPIVSLDEHKPRKIPGVHDCPAGGNTSHLKHTRNKVKVWIAKMKNGHLSSSM